MTSNAKRQRVGLYGGTFDPIHVGHLNLAVALQQAGQLDEIWFCPASLSPLKDKTPHAPFADRVNMLRIATADFPNTKVLTLEGDRPGPSFTIDTVNHLLSTQPTADIHLIIGDDAIQGLPRWKEIDLLLTKVKLVVGSRYPANVDLTSLPPKLAAAVRAGLTTTPLFDISATELRQRLAHNAYCGYAIPQKVLDYISEHELYSF